MAVSQAQIVDLLYKQAFGVTKTDTSTNKSPSNESIPSPLLLRGDTLWTQASSIPGTAAATAGIVQAYTGTSAVQCAADTTTVPIGGIYPTWKTNLTYWIPSEFGSTYTAQVWIDNPGVANPTATGTQIFAAGSGGTGQYYYNYQSGVLNFIGETIPAGLTSGKVLYIVGYRYIGLTGVTNLPSGTAIGNLTFNGSTIGSTSNANITFSPNGTGIVKFTSEISSNSNISTTGSIAVTGNANISGNISANYITGNGAGLTGVTASSSDKLSNGNSTVSVYQNGNVTFSIANSANSNVPIANVIVVSTSGIDILGNITATGNINGATINGNISGNISGNITIPGPNTGVVFNDNGNANSSSGFTFDTTTNSAYIANSLEIGGYLTIDGAINAFSTLNLTGNIALGNLYENQIVNLSNSSLEIRGGYDNAAGQLNLFAGGSGNSALISLQAASNGIYSQADSFTFYNRANNFTLVTISNTTTVSTSTSTGAVVANGGVGVSGNIFVGGLINVTGNVTTSALIAPSLTSNFANLLLTASSGDNSVVLVPTGNGTVDVSSKRITSLATPTASTDAATKQYVDDVAQGLNIHDSTQAATANSLANLTGGTITYNNGTAGVGANLVLTGSPTANFISANVFDGNVTLSANSRLLVKNETNQAYNGIYVVSNATVLTRAADYNSVPEIEAGDFVFVTGGTTYDNTGWVQTSTVVTVGTDPIEFTQFSGAGTYQAGNGLSLNGSVFSVNVDNNTTAIVGGNVVVKDGANLTTPNIGAATGNSLTLTDGVTANTLTANLTLDVTGNANVGNLGTSGIVSATGNVSGGNITTTGVVSATGNVSGGNITTAGIVSATGNVSGGNITTIGVVSATGNVSGGNITTLGEVVGGNITTTGIVSATGNVSGGNITTLGVVSATGNVSGGNITTLGVVSATGNVSGGNITTLGVVSATGNVSGGNITTTGEIVANTANITGNVTIGNVTVNLELSGNTANFSGNVIAGNLRSNALTATRVTFAGTNGVLTDSANLIWNNSTELLNVGDANIGGNVGNGYVSVAKVYSSSLSTTRIAFTGSDSGGNLLVDSANFTFTGGNLLSVTGDANVTGNVSAGNLITTGTINTASFTTSLLSIGNTSVTANTVTTSAITANQTIASYQLTGGEVTGIEFLVKGHDTTANSKYSVATVLAVTDGSNVDYTTYGTVRIGSSTGTLAVNIGTSGGNSYVNLQATPSSTNNTVWTTQIRTI